jgi:hypothetical protein
VSTEKPETEKEAGPAESEGGVIAAARAQAESFLAGIATVRTRTDAAAKIVASLGTAGISAIGIAKFADVFPYEGPGWALAAVIAGFVAMGIAVAVLTARLWRTQQPLVVRSNVDAMVAAHELSDNSREFGRTEKELVEDVYDDMTVLNDVDSLSAYEARGRRLERVARHLPGEPAKMLLDEADQIRAEVLVTHARAAHAVIRRRANKAVRGLWTSVFFAVFLLGLAGVALGADSLESGRTEQDRVEAEQTFEIGYFKSCADAYEVGVVEEDLPADCPDVEVRPETPTDQTDVPAASP